MAWLVSRGGRWYVRYFKDGRRYWFSCKTDNLKTASKIKARIETDLAEGRHLDRVQPSSWTLGELRTWYLDRHGLLKPKSYAWRRDRFAQIVAGIGETYPIEEITVETLDAYVQQRLSDGLAFSTVALEAWVLQHAMKKAHHAADVTFLTEYRLGRWEKIKGEPKTEPVFLEPDEVRRVLKASAARAKKGSAHDRDGDLWVRLALGTGARPEEIIELRSSQLDPRGILHLKTVKRGPRRFFQLAPDLAAEIRQRPGSFVFEPLPRCKPKDRFKDFWSKIETAAKVTARPYDLRHTFASEFLRRGGTMRDLQRLLGHISARMTERYSHFSRDFVAPKAITWTGARRGAPKRPLRAVTAVSTARKHQ